MNRKVIAWSAAAVLALSLSLIALPAAAKCKGDCRKLLAHEMVACKAACGHGRAANACRKACSREHLSGLRACKKAANPTPPVCSPSGAFL